VWGLLGTLAGWLAHRRVPRQSLATARLVMLDLETTGPDMFRDRIIAVGAMVVAGGVVRHGQGFERTLRQGAPSTHANILVHRIGGQQQLAGVEPGPALHELLDFIGDSLVLAFRAEFDATVLRRELRAVLPGTRRPPFVDLALLLPACFPGTQNDTLDDWLAHFGIEPPGRHAALADAYAGALLLLPVLERASQLGCRTLRDLCAMARAQRWLGRRR
jgi:DNA polymerase-3 subunit epsilon